MKIEKSVQMPKKETRGAPRKYPFLDMDVGDSVFFDGEKISQNCRPYIAASVTGKNHCMKFSGRTVDGGVRIWRIA